MKSKIPIDPPVYRKLKVLAFDPSLAVQLDTAEMNEITLAVPWEVNLEPGPIGEYIEVIDYDPASRVFYEPVDLNDPHIIAQDGLAPSESNPQFHQQMVYAVAMTTIRQFEKALGRVAFWADRKVKLKKDSKYIQQFVPRLRIYPHALRDRNAYYSPAKKSLLFGYFPVINTTSDSMFAPGTLIFTSLSHDIIAHEVTHALLDGVHPRFNNVTNLDVAAFHEAFADIVALFQHFSYPQVLENQIRKTQGDLETENLLGQLAQEFGKATGSRSALRDALGSKDDKTGAWEPKQPDPNALENTVQPHARGSILVAAVFRAFILMYNKLTRDLLRIATQGTGKLPEGDIHPDLTKRLSQEASSCAERVLQMCIRAIDYCPPVNINFGDFLRGLITADLDFSPEDDEFRIVFIQSFREWGIFPRNITSMGIDALKWPSSDELLRDEVSLQYSDPIEKSEKDYEIFRETRRSMRSDMKEKFLKKIENWNLESDRHSVWKTLFSIRSNVREWLLNQDSGKNYSKIFGLVVDQQDIPATVYQDSNGFPTVEVHSVRPAVRQTYNGSSITDIVVEITQGRRGFFDPKEQERMDKTGSKQPENGDFIYRAGSTIFINPATQEVRHVIRTPGNITDNHEINMLRNFLLGIHGTSGNSFDSGIPVSMKIDENSSSTEPFFILHQGTEN